MEVEPGSRLVRERARHERRAVPVRPCNLAQHLLREQERVGEAERVERAEIELVLSGAAFVMPLVDRHPAREEPTRRLPEHLLARALGIVEVPRVVERQSLVVEQVELDLGPHRQFREEVHGVAQERFQRVPRVGAPAVAIGRVHRADRAGDPVTEVHQRLRGRDGSTCPTPDGRREPSSAEPSNPMPRSSATSRRDTGTCKEWVAPKTSTNVSRSHSTPERSRSWPLTTGSQSRG